VQQSHSNLRSGICRGMLWFSAILLVPGCGDGVIAPTDAGQLHVSGVMSTLHQRIRVSRADAGVTDAEVTVNGVHIPHTSGGLYVGTLLEAVPAGSPITLVVRAGGLTLEGTGNALVPVIIAPATGSAIASTDSITVAWTSATDPDVFEVCLNCTDDWYRVTFPLPGTARELRISGRDLVDWGTGAVVAIWARKKDFLALTGAVSPSSRVDFSGSSPDAVFTIEH
jgi:hypothetical protein